MVIAPDAPRGHLQWLQVGNDALIAASTLKIVGHFRAAPLRLRNFWWSLAAADASPHDQSQSRATLTLAFNGYKAGLFKRAQRPGFRVRLDTPFLQHQAGNGETI
jgi:hypothetical protein